jgi:hypothetical protein
VDYSKYLKASLKAQIEYQTEPAYRTGRLVDVVLGYEKPQVGFDRLNLTRFLEMG